MKAMNTGRSARGAHCAWLLLLLLLPLSATAACTRTRVPEDGNNGNTNWLRQCSAAAQCGDDAACVCGVCTRACEDGADCGGELQGTVCTSTDDAAMIEACGGAASVERACVAPCSGDDECTSLGEGLACVSGTCASAAVADADPGSTSSGSPPAGSDSGIPDGITWGPGGPPSVVEGPRLCAGVECSEGQLCCYTSGTCFDPGDAAVCPTPTTADYRFAPEGAAPCASDADCPDGEACTGASRCLGAGVCLSRTNCGSGGRLMCGCDGRDYPDVQSACFAGTRVATTDAPCGVRHEVGVGGASASGLPVTGCGNDADCSAPELCCSLTGRCYDPALPILCTAPPEGTEQSCLEDAHCIPGSYCKRDGCEGPGGCVSPSGDCGGRLEPVCGCDGVSYTSAECADTAGVNVSHAGSCERP